MAKQQIESVVDLAKALADSGRLRTLMALGNGELCVCQIVELLDLASSTVSRHMSVLRRAGLVQSRKQGRWVYYRLVEDPSPAESDALAWATRALAESAEARRDRERLERILCLSPETLCRLQYKRSEGDVASRQETKGRSS